MCVKYRRSLLHLALNSILPQMQCQSTTEYYISLSALLTYLQASILLYNPRAHPHYSVSLSKNLIISSRKDWQQNYFLNLLIHTFVTFPI